MTDTTNAVPLTAPEHLRGNHRRGSKHAAFHDERAAWIRDRLVDGHTGRNIAAALGVNEARISAVAKKYGFALPRRSTTRKSQRKYLGIYVGGFREPSMTELVDSMPPADYHRLLDIAARHEVTLAEALVIAFQERGRGQ